MATCGTGSPGCRAPEGGAPIRATISTQGLWLRIRQSDLPNCLSYLAARQRRRSGQAARGGCRVTIAGRLIEDAVGRHGFDERGRICGLGDFECVESRAMEEQELVAQHLAGCAQLAAIMIALA